MSPFLLEFIDSPFMTGVFYVMMFGMGAIALGVTAVLWKLTRGGIRNWRAIRTAPQPAPLLARLQAVLMVTPGIVVGLLAAFALLLYVGGSWEERRWYRENAVRVQQHQDSTRTALTGNYFLADTLLLATGYDSFADSIPPAPVHAHLVLRPDSTYSYHSSIPNDVTLDTAGTWKMVGYSYDVRFKYAQFSVAFTPVWQSKCGLRISHEGNGPTYSQGAYYRDNGFTSFELTQPWAHQ